MAEKSPTEKNDFTITVVIPAFRVRAHILEVLKLIGDEVQHVLVIDDKCPEKSGEYVQLHNVDPRVEVIFNPINLGVGGAVKSGYRRAIELNSDVVVKIDGDGQMDCSKIQDITMPIRSGEADYTKGNRFFDVAAIRQMPPIRIFGNLVLSFMTKLSSGYWTVFDPNNGFTAISKRALNQIPLSKIDDGYFFESDMLFRLNLLKVSVLDIPMPAIYDNEKSNLKIRRVLFEFPLKHFRNFSKRIMYTYYLRDFNMASIELPLGIALSGFGIILGLFHWSRSLISGIQTQTGTAVLVAMSVLAGLQLILAFLAFDTNANSNHRQS
jgi:dolichol-phosphate mannosyltransferase